MMDYTKMSLIYVITVCTCTSVALATQDQQLAMTQDQQSALTQDQQPAWTQDQQPALTQDQQPALTQDQQPALTQDQQPALTQDQQPALTLDQQPALTQDQQPALTDEQLASSPLIQRLLARVDVLEKQGVKQQEEIHILKAEMTQQRGYVTKLRFQLHAKDRLLQALLRKNSKSGEVETTSEEKQYPHSDMQDVSNEREHRMKMRSEDSMIRRADNEVMLAFSAGLSQHMLHVGDKQNIIFDQVITNVGNAYYPHQGTFIAPVSGVYVFSTSIQSYYDSRSSYAFITVNGIDKCALEMYDSNSRSTASQTMVFELNQGDDVSIHGRTGDAYYGASPSYTTFSGFLLQQNYPSAGQIVG